ncbi:MAG TPA: HEAT repeat domain-containing protein [Pyrinomonadaceae bacterium]|nr:HEAT repeat domain-containing protein [Pyrinomonadaceae bacterium]
MPKSTALITLALALFPPNAACAATPTAFQLDAAAQANAAQQQSAMQTPKFTPVEGADLKAKLAEAARLAGGAGKPFWTAYAFDVRPGVAVDPGGGEFHGSMMSSGGTHVFVGTSNGVRVETRDLGVFLLREPGREGFTRMEVYNLRRPREYAGHAVYWAGRAANEESLNLLRALVEPGQRPDVRERATLALALHDDARVAAMLKDLVRSSREEGIRSTAVFWLGQGGGEIAYLSGIVRDGKETEDLRRAAAHAIGASRDGEALSALQSLYSTSLPADVKRGIIHAVAGNENRPAAYAFLLRVAQTDRDAESRRTAVHQLGETGGDTAVEDLVRIYGAERDTDVRRAVIHALAESNSPRAEARINEIARDASGHEDLRQQAIHQIAERDTEAAFDELTKIFESDRSPDVRRHILHAFSEMKTPRAHARLTAAARDTRELEDVRRHALHWLAEQKTDAAVDELIRIFDAEPSGDVKRHILHALAEMENRRAEDKLFEVASRGGDEELRRSALHMLGELAGERSLQVLGHTAERAGEPTEVQVQAVRAISERPAEQAVPMLLKVARTHPNPEVRKEAIQQLADSADPRAVEFFREVLTKK